MHTYSFLLYTGMIYYLCNHSTWKHSSLFQSVLFVDSLKNHFHKKPRK